MRETGPSEIGFTGLGSMGRPMAANLLSAEFKVRGFDPSEDAMAELIGNGGTAATSTKAASEGLDLSLLMVVNAAQAEDALFANGALGALVQGGTVVLLSTCRASDVERLAAAVQGIGRTLIDAPVSGGTEGARAGSLTIMAAGEADTLESLDPVFGAITGRVFVVGDRPSQGALALAERLDLDRDTMLEIVTGSAASSWMLKDRALGGMAGGDV